MLNLNLGPKSVADVQHAAWLKDLQLHSVDLFLTVSSIINKAELSSDSVSSLPSRLMHEPELYIWEGKEATARELNSLKIEGQFNTFFFFIYACIRHIYVCVYIYIGGRCLFLKLTKREKIKKKEKIKINK